MSKGRLLVHQIRSWWDFIKWYESNEDPISGMILAGLWCYVGASYQIGLHLMLFSK